MKVKNPMNRSNCPQCGCSWVGNPIPEELRKEYGGRRYFTRLVQNYDWKTKKVVAYECPDCELSMKAEGGK